MRTVVVGLLLAASVLGHAWLECVDTFPANDNTRQNINANTPNVDCKGYLRRYPGRDNQFGGGVALDIALTYRILGFNNGAMACSDRQRDPTYFGPYTATRGAAGETKTFKYTTNGHTDTDRVRGTGSRGVSSWTIYMSTVPDNDQIITRGDLFNAAKARPIASSDFGDGSCGEIKPGSPNFVCFENYRIPQGLAPGRYQFVWFWGLNNNPSGEEYTSCWDVYVSGGSGALPLPTAQAPATTSRPVVPPTVPAPAPTQAPAAPGVRLISSCNAQNQGRLQFNCPDCAGKQVSFMWFYLCPEGQPCPQVTALSAAQLSPANNGVFSSTVQSVRQGQRYNYWVTYAIVGQGQRNTPTNTVTTPVCGALDLNLGSDSFETDFNYSKVVVAGAVGFGFVALVAFAAIALVARRQKMSPRIVYFAKQQQMMPLRSERTEAEQVAVL